MRANPFHRVCLFDLSSQRDRVEQVPRATLKSSLAAKTPACLKGIYIAMIPHGAYNILMMGVFNKIRGTFTRRVVYATIGFTQTLNMLNFAYWQKKYP